MWRKHFDVMPRLLKLPGQRIYHDFLTTQLGQSGVGVQANAHARAPSTGTVLLLENRAKMRLTGSVERACTAASFRSIFSAMRRILKNLMRLPTRTFKSLWQWRSPAYRLQRQARAAVNRWLGPERRKHLLQVPGFSSEPELQ